jgi:trehalose 6-phosphate synthase/phosphatase
VAWSVAICPVVAARLAQIISVSRLTNEAHNLHRSLGVEPIGGWNAKDDRWPDRMAVEMLRVRGARKRVLILDYDGTLVPIAPVPDLATPDPDLLMLLRNLSSRPHTEVHIVSGRGRDWMEHWLAGWPMRLHAEHGFWSRMRGGSWVANAPVEPSWKATVLAIARAHARAAAGALIEEKHTGVAFHYRCVDPSLAHATISALRAALLPLLAIHPIELLDGRRVLEVRPRGVNKGRVIEKMIRGGDLSAGTVLLAAGDDATDEDMFAALPADAVTIHVGRRDSTAACRVAQPAELRAHLRSLLD